jgi:hypothetical protein
MVRTKAGAATADQLDPMEELVFAVRRLGNAVTANVVGGQDATGGHVECLTEAMMGVTAGLCRIAEAIEGLADALRPGRVMDPDGLDPEG